MWKFGSKASSGAVLCSCRHLSVTSIAARTSSTILRHKNVAALRQMKSAQQMVRPDCFERRRFLLSLLLRQRTNQCNTQRSFASKAKKKDEKKLEKAQAFKKAVRQQAGGAPAQSQKAAAAAADMGASWEEFTASRQNNFDSPTYVLPDSHKEMFQPELHMANAPTDWTGYEEASPLWHELASWIGVTGQPISVAEYMRMCLTHPQHGYYTVGRASAADEFDDEEWDEKDKDDHHHDETSVIGGDFVTAPEMSQIFGECLGIWISLVLQQQEVVGKGPWQYVEAGPGKGSLLVDLMRFWKALSKGKTLGDHAIPAAVHLLETSPNLRKVQRERLEKDVGHQFDLKFVDVTPSGKQKAEDVKEEAQAGGDANTGSKPTVRVYWHDSLNTLQIWQKQQDSYMPTFCICQEFMDALPVYAFQKTAEGWRERLVDIALREDIQKQEEEEHGIVTDTAAVSSVTKDMAKLRLRIVLSPEPTAATKTLLRLTEDGLMPAEVERGVEAPVGSIVEINPEAVLFTQDLAKMVGQQGGGCLVIDYGQEDGSRDSIRAFGHHKQVHFLSQPGQVDVTADVDFGALKHAVNVALPHQLQLQQQLTEPLVKARAHGPVAQGIFLMAMGAKDRALQLAELDGVTEEQHEQIYQALVRLCSAEEMGERFKVLSIVPARGNSKPQPPPGF